MKSEPRPINKARGTLSFKPDIWINHTLVSPLLFVLFLPNFMCLLHTSDILLPSFLCKCRLCPHWKLWFVRLWFKSLKIFCNDCFTFSLDYPVMPYSSRNFIVTIFCINAGCQWHRAMPFESEHKLICKTFTKGLLCFCSFFFIQYTIAIFIKLLCKEIVFDRYLAIPVQIERLVWTLSEQSLHL